jgi:hypothetical protein
MLQFYLFCSKDKEQIQTVVNENEGFKKASVEEMLKNEYLTIILKKIHSEEANLKRMISVEEEKKGALEIHLSAVHKMLGQTDKEMQEVILVSVSILQPLELVMLHFIWSYIISVSTNFA